jgi:hypothetical protein
MRRGHAATHVFWEHAYYIDIRNDRAKYLDAFWRLVNWHFVAANLAADADNPPTDMASRRGFEPRLPP